MLKTGQMILKVTSILPLSRSLDLILAHRDFFRFTEAFDYEIFKVFVKLQSLYLFLPNFFKISHYYQIQNATLNISYVYYVPLLIEYGLLTIANHCILFYPYFIQLSSFSRTVVVI